MVNIIQTKRFGTHKNTRARHSNTHGTHHTAHSTRKRLQLIDRIGTTTNSYNNRAFEFCMRETQRSVKVQSVKLHDAVGGGPGQEVARGKGQRARVPWF